MNPREENHPKKPAAPAVSPDDAPRPTMTDSHEAFVEKAMADYESPLIGYAASLLHDLDRARDVVQDTFIRLCQQDAAKVSEHLKTWLFTVCRNRALDVLRKESRIQELDEVRWQKVAGNELPPDQAALHEEKLATVMKALDRLSANQREVILLKFQQGLSYREIEQVTGLSQGNIGFLIHNGLKRVRELLPHDLR